MTKRKIRRALVEKEFFCFFFHFAFFHLVRACVCLLSYTLCFYDHTIFAILALRRRLSLSLSRSLLGYVSASVCRIFLSLYIVRTFTP